MVGGVAVHQSGSNVVFLPGAGLLGLDYLNVAGDAVLYDRGGTGWSDPVPLPRSATAVASELFHVLPGPGPYVLAGHSLGGVYARRFAQMHPDRVAGLLLIDPAHEDLFAYLPPAAAALNKTMRPTDLPDLTAEQITAATAAYQKLYATWPPDVRAELIEKHLTHWRTGLAESENLESEVYDELRGGGPVPDVPTIVLTAGLGNPAWHSFAPEPDVLTALAGIRRLHGRIAGEMTHGEHRVIEGATHQYLHIEHPEAVTTAIRDLTSTR
jgi:pimeloyl-ACP methyl ester carboxylesterase